MKQIITPLLLFLSFSLYGQKVYVVDYPFQADVKLYEVRYPGQADVLVYKSKYRHQATGNKGYWFFTRTRYAADKTVFFVKYSYQADVKVYFVRYPSQSTWRNQEMKKYFE